MALTVHTSELDDAVLLRCEGRIVCGPETEQLERQVRSLLHSFGDVILDLSAVSFIDSGGLGLLVRMMASARAAGGDLKVAAPSPQIVKLLETTCLARVFQLFTSSEEAVALMARPSTTAAQVARRVLCVDQSCDFLSFLRTVLQGAGYAVSTSDNLSDAAVLLRASPADVLVLGPNLHPGRAREFRAQPRPCFVIELDLNFPHLEAAQATALLLEKLPKAADFGSQHAKAS